VTKLIDLGYELESGARVKIPLNHMAILGQTQLSGKTTAMEAVALRGDVRAISFITKPGERSFRQRTSIPAFFSEASVEEYWKHVVAMLEYRSEVKLGWRERGVVIKLCQDYKKEGSRIGFDTKTGKSKRERMAYKWKVPKTLGDVLTNLEAYLPYARSAEEMICIQLREFLRPVISEIEKTEFSDKLQLARGINVMDITELSDGLKSLVIRSVIEWVHKHGRKIVVIIPEAWKFIPEGRSTPVKLALEGLIREGAGVGNFVWMDSQDLRGVDKLLLRSVIVWLFGVQRQKNEVASTLASIPDHPKPSATEIMQLGKGEFYVCYGTTLVRTYVQPAGMENAHAQAIARGEERPESWSQIVRSLDEETIAESLGDSECADRSSQPRIDGGMARTAESESESGPHRTGLAGVEGAEFSGDEEMWKEKYEAFMSALAQSLGCENEPDKVIETIGDLKRGHDHLAERIRESEAAGETVLLIPPKSSAATQAGTAGKVAEASTLGASAVPSNGNYDAIYRYVVNRAAKEDPKTIAVLLQRPEILLNFERKTVDIDGKSVMGGMALLISKGFFDRPTGSTPTIKELRRIGYSFKDASVQPRFSELVSMGFLTRESDGFRAVPEMKTNIKGGA
jgi:hypothetical protein